MKSREKKTIFFYGPFLEEYSLARVNRGLFTELTKLVRDNYDLKCGSHNINIDKIENYPEIRDYIINFEIFLEQYGEPDLLIYNDFPANPENGYEFSKLSGKVKGTFLAWEEDLFPRQFVEEYNEQLDFVLACSSQTKFILQKSGVNLPILILPNAISEDFHINDDEINNRKKAKFRSKLIKTQKKTIIFHNSSGIPRKGMDVLLKSYQQAFSASDDVCLVIKTFPNRDNQLDEVLADLSWKIGDTRDESSNFPEIEIIRSVDLSEKDLVDLYLSADLYVSPSRAEGFNLPLLEAMRLGIPTIATGWGGHLDFANEYTSYLLDYELVPAVSQLNNPGAYWAEPKQSSLVSHLTRLVKILNTSVEEAGQAQDLNRKIIQAKNTAKKYVWDLPAKKLVEMIPKLVDIGEFKGKKLGIMSTYNSVCGIAEYTDYLFAPIENVFSRVNYYANSDAIPLQQNIETEKNIQRVWEEHSIDFSSLTTEVISRFKEGELDYFHIQYNLWKFSLVELAKIIQILANQGVPVIITPHSVRGDNFDLKVIGSSLSLCSAIILINQNDYNYLHQKGYTNIHYLPHGNTFFPIQNKKHLRSKLGINTDDFIVANHGFAVPSKGFVQTVKAVKLLEPDYPNISYLGFTAVNPEQINSQKVAEDIKEEYSDAIDQSKYISIWDFLDRNQILTGLAAADVAVFAYDEAVETASGAIRLALAVGLPIIITDSSQLADLQDTAYKINNNNSETISKAIIEFINNPELLDIYSRKSRELASRWDWDEIAIDYLQILNKL